MCVPSTSFIQKRVQYCLPVFQYCIGGSCRPWSSDPTPKVVQGGWGAWNTSQCSSGCLDKALGTWPG